MDLMDELYGDIDHRPSETPLHHNEDSVDIYSGLENSPMVDGHRSKVKPILSPRTMESMDIYEEIIREEQEEKEATYNELKQKFDVAQKQVSDLLSKLQLLQTKNSSLTSENILLKKNICSLIKTARMEIVRKDEEISRLSNRSGRGSYGHNFRQSQMESFPANTRHTLNNTRCSVVESQGTRQDKVMNGVNQHKGRNTSTTTSSAASQPFEVLQRCPRTEIENPPHCQNKSAAKSDREILSIQTEQEYRSVHPNKTTESIKCPTTVPDFLNASKTNNLIISVPAAATDSQMSNLKDNKNSPSNQVDEFEKPQNSTSQDKICNSKNKDLSPQSKLDGNLSKPVMMDKQLAKDNSGFSNNENQQPEIPDVLTSSEQSKSPSSQSSVSSQSSRSSVKTVADVDMQSQEHIHKQNADRTRETRHCGLSSTTCSVVDEESHFQNHKGKKRDASGPDRKEEKSSSTERRSCKSERSRDHEQKRPKENDRSKRDKSNNCSSRERRSSKSESSRGCERRHLKGKDYKDEDKRSTKQVDASESRRASSSPKRDSQRKDKSSSRSDEASSKSKRSHRHDKSRKVDDLKYHGKNGNSDEGIEKHREGKRDGHSKEDRVQKHRESKSVSKDDRKNSSKKHKISRKSHDSKTQQDKPSVVDVTSNPCKTTEDDSPDRKLSFMETLNLTLSPLKKQKQSSDAKEAIGVTSEDNSRCSDAGEEFFVIDELKNSQESVEEMDEPTNKEDLTCSFRQSVQAFDVLTAETSDQKNPSTEKSKMEIQNDNITESQEAVDKVAVIIRTSEEKENMSLESIVLDKDSVSKLTPTKESQNHVCQSPPEDCPEIKELAVVFKTSPTKRSESVVSNSIPESKDDGSQQQDLCTAVSKETSQMEIQGNMLPMSQIPASNGVCQDDVSSSDKEETIAKISSSENSESSANMEVSSSTVCADLEDPSKIICDLEKLSPPENESNSRELMENSEVVETQQTSENVKISEKFLQSPPRNENDIARIDSNDAGKETMSFVQPGFSEPDSTEKEELIPKSSSAVVLNHDEDSMMLTLRNIRAIPEPISPLTSPVRQVKKVQPQRAEKQAHVKSLNKDLSTVTTGSDKDKVNMEMNKENKSPDSSVTGSSNKATKDALSASATEEEELEDGEIVSESEEEGPLYIQTPPREQDKATPGTRTNPKLSAVGKKGPQRTSYVPAKNLERSKSSKLSSANNSPTSSKRRFKTVSPSSKAAIYTLDGFMDMLGSIRLELRRKYMKLQKNVTKTAFCCIVDMSHASFTEFINGVDLDKFCCQDSDIKVRLNKIVSSIMSKVTKNGIVNRIFEQRAGDLKQKLWTFVDGQFDFLFKELKMALKSISEPSKSASFENKTSTLKRKEVESEVVEKEHFSTPGPLPIAKKSKVDTVCFIREAPQRNLPHRGLGSRGKNIKAVMNEDDQPAKVETPHQLPTLSSERSVHEGASGSENRTSFVRRLSHNGSIQDKSDFDLLTEQQTSSLTFNLVSDSQMGEIFKCLLQGSDLLESSVPVGENTSWPLSTPRKEGLSGESLIGIMTPNKTPFKSIASWASISPYRFASNSKMLVDPAILDESCLLEVPSNSEPCQLQSTIVSQRSFSILAEDLAVSLTIPSPLKSDSHLSFLHPGTGQPLSAPSSVLSAHYSEDALLDGEDATEQDIHLSLDTDNSSCGSSPSRTWEASDASGFQFQPNLPMQAVVMERSNDHFIVRIRRTSTSPNKAKAIPLLVEPSPEPNLDLIQKELSSASGAGEMSNKSPTVINEPCHISQAAIETQPLNQKSSPEVVCDNTSCNNAKPISIEVSFQKSTALEESSKTESKTPDLTGNVENSIQTPSAPECEPERVSRKRKEHHSESKSKRAKVEKSQEQHSKSRHKKKSKPSKEKSLRTAAPPVSPSSLSAKNVIRKKGEVVVSWTRDEDRDILIELKMKGTSPKTFAALAKKLSKSSEQIEERFSQLMKLFKKKEKMEN